MNAYDVKGDLPNLMLRFPSFDPSLFTPWVEAAPGDEDGIADPPLVAHALEKHRQGLADSSIGEAELAAHVASTHVRVVTPGSDAGEPLHVLSALERSSPRWETDLPGARATLSAAISLVLRLIGRESDPAKSREHALLSVLAEERLRRGAPAALEQLVPWILEPQLESIGALEIDQFVGARARAELAADLNTLIASPVLASWRRGQDLDVAKWMAPVDINAREWSQDDTSGAGEGEDGNRLPQWKTPATIVSVAHLDDEERGLVLGVLLEEVLTWVRSLPGSGRLRALVVFDEVYGYLPPHPASPPTKRPLVALMKQARAYGVGVVIATQNPMDLDYRALSNAGTWMLGRLQTDADRTRVMEGLGEDKKKSELGALVKKLAPRWFVVRDARSSRPTLLRPRWAMSYLKGPMTQHEIRKANEIRDNKTGETDEQPQDL